MKVLSFNICNLVKMMLLNIHFFNVQNSVSVPVFTISTNDNPGKTTKERSFFRMNNRTNMMTLAELQHIETITIYINKQQAHYLK